MIAVGSLALRGTLDTTDIEKGYGRVNAGFQNMKGHAKSFGSDMSRISQTISGMAKKLVLLGVAGAGTMIALAKSAPAVAPALAKMGISIFKLSNSLGRALAPAFERVAVWLETFSSWFIANEDRIGTFANKVLDLASSVGRELYPHLKAIGNWALDHPKLFTTIFAGLALGTTAIAGIAAVTSLAGALGTLVVSSSALIALASIAAIAAAGPIGTAIGEATYEEHGKGFVTSGAGSLISAGFMGLKDLFSGDFSFEGTKDYLRALAAFRAREDDRAYNLLNMDDRNIG